MPRPFATILPVLALTSATAVGWHSTITAAGPGDPPEQPSILVNPASRGLGTAQTIQEAVDRITPGGKVLVLPGAYPETIAITKGMTIEAIGGESGQAVVAPTGTPQAVIEILTTEPVTIRGLTISVPGLNGIRGVGEVDLTVDHVAVIAPVPFGGGGSLILVSNDRLDGSRAQMVVRNSFIDGGIGYPAPAQNFGIRPQGNVDALLQGNVIRRAGGACIFVVTRSDLGGETNVDVLSNDLDECHPFGRVSAILAGPLAGNVPSPSRPLTATGTVNVVGNTIRNSSKACLASAIAYEVYSGRIEHNRIIDYVQPCAALTGRNMPSAIWVGRLSTGTPFPPVMPSVRFNDLQGNAHAGLRIAPNQTVPIEASCNYWGTEWGPSGVGQGDGSALLVEPGGATPYFTPFATGPIAGSKTTGC